VNKVSLERKTIKNWVPEERPREMLYAIGPKRMSLAKLVAIILRTGNDKNNAEELARSLINKYGTLRAIYDAPMEQLCSIKGFGLAKSAQLKAALELGKRMTQEKSNKQKKLLSMPDIKTYIDNNLREDLANLNKEHFIAILLDAKRRPIRTITLSTGGRNASIVDIPEIIKQASIHSAAGIILVHNHPSGDSKPSPEDVYLTTRVKQACELVGIEMIDHMIVGNNRDIYFSLAQFTNI